MTFESIQLYYCHRDKPVRGEVLFIGWILESSATTMQQLDETINYHVNKKNK
jgi:hypothetical protein